jgi:hypothetical protein
MKNVRKCRLQPIITINHYNQSLQSIILQSSYPIDCRNEYRVISRYQEKTYRVNMSWWSNTERTTGDLDLIHVVTKRKKSSTK